MSGPPTISVILPTCYRPGLLAEALRSLAAQELPPDEVIVVDDGCAGEARAAEADIWSDRLPPLVVIEGPGRGPGAARNAGLWLARGELAAFLDDDDLWHPAKLAQQAKWFARRSSLGALGTACVQFTADLAATRWRWRAVEQGARGIRTISLAAMLRANRLTLSSVVARRELVEACGGFDESLPLAQDWDLWLRLAERTELAALPQPLVWYRRHGGQRSGEAMAIRRWEGEVLRRALARGLPRRLHNIARRRLAWSHVRLGRLLARAGETARAREEFHEAMALWRCSPVAWAGMMRCIVSGSALARART